MGISLLHRDISYNQYRLMEWYLSRKDWEEVPGFSGTGDAIWSKGDKIELKLYDTICQSWWGIMYHNIFIRCYTRQLQAIYTMLCYVGMDYAVLLG